MPLVPNFKPGIGRLVTDRFDFQDHIEGTNFRHKAGAIDLFPTITIGSTVIDDVQTAIEALSGSIIVPSVPDATTVSKGIIQLSGDIAGTATNISVVQLRGTPVTSFAGLAPNQVLTWNGSAWINAVVPGAIQIAGDLAGVGSTLAVPRVGGIQGFAVSNATPSTGQALVWNGSVWIPTGIPTSPTGTGFATLTSGTYDAAATANIRYASGKFQTDVNLQFKNVSITGDLSWTPTSTNKTLTLPDITDVLVTRTNSETLTNKTINATDNTITDNSVALGDILAIVSGTKFTRLAKGANGTFLGVSGGTLGYFTPSGSTPSGTGFATVTGGVFDAAATANIRYTGGKFQTDTSIQFKNAAITGDLAWAPSGSNKTITLPNTSDTVVCLSTIDALANKTINASLNTITDTGIAVGDLLKGNGTSFVRFARGTAQQVLRINTGGTDLEWATVNTTTPSRLNQSGAGQLLDVVTTDGSGNPATVIRFTGDGAATDILLSGLVAPSNPNNSLTNQRITLVCTSTTGNKLIISNQDTTESTAINRLKWFGAANTQYVVGTDGYSIDVVWDNFDQRWRPLINLRAIEYGVI